MPTASRSRRIAWAGACLACVAVIVVAAVLIVTHHTSPVTTATPVAADHTTASAHTSSASAAPVARPKIPANLAGTWSGTVRQTDPALAVTVRISLAAGTSAGTISYPQLGCSGRLLLVSVLAGTFTLEQGISKGQQSCDNGTVLLSPQGTTALAFKFRRSDAPSPAGVLAKTGS
jgi:hypothetical protein